MKYLKRAMYYLNLVIFPRRKVYKSACYTDNVAKILAYLKTINTTKFGVYFLLASFFISVSVFILPKLRQSAQIKLGSPDGLSVTADRQDSLGTFVDSRFTLKTDNDIKSTDLKNSLTFFPEIDFDIQSISSRQFTIIPKSALQNNHIYKIQVKTSTRNFSWAFQTKNDFRIVQTLPRNRATYVPLNTGIEISFSHDNWESKSTSQ
jgi:hypothetical protein